MFNFSLFCEFCESASLLFYLWIKEGSLFSSENELPTPTFLSLVSLLSLVKVS